MALQFADKLYKYQIQHTDNLVNIIKSNNSVLDASDTGTGKTYCAVVACKILKLNPIIICPKSVKSTWKDVCKIFNLKPIIIVNYELIQRGKYSADGIHKKFKYINVNNNKYKWNPPPKSIFIFDEAHRCRNINTTNAKLLIGAKSSEKPIMILSATIADKPENFNLFFYILDFINKDSAKKSNLTYSDYIRIMTKWIFRRPKPMVRIHNMLYPERASRMRIDVLGDMFPETQITAEPYSMGDKREKEIQKEYSILAEQLDIIRDKSNKDKKGILPKIIRSHQKIEILKIPTFVELTKDFIENGFSVVIFVNFTKTIETLSKMLNTNNIIYGEQTEDERIQNIKNFQDNSKKIIICNIRAGGVGISLHDIYGNHPRVSLLSPTWSSTDLVQALGRIHRAGGKSKSLQRIIYSANTIEKNIAEKLREKLKNINSINNGDLDLTGINFISNIKKN